MAFFNHSGEVSGAEISLLQTVQALARRGIEPLLVIPQKGELAEKARALDVEVRFEEFGIPRMTRNPRRLVAGMICVVVGAWRLARIVRAARAEIVHANSIRAGLMASLGRPLHKCPVVWNVRDFLPGRLIGTAIRWTALATADRIISNSQAVANDFASSASLRAKTMVVYPGLPESPNETGGPHDYREAWGIRPTDFVVGYVGQIAPWKRVHDAILAFRQVTKECDNTWLVVAGAPKFRKENHEYLGELHALVEECGLTGRVRFLGFQNEIGAVYRSLDVLVHPAAREPFGRVLVEAMAQGVPVIAAADGGVPEIVRDGKTGLLFPVGDVERIGGCILELLRDRVRRDQFGEAGRAVALQAFQIDQTVSKILTLYRSLLFTPGSTEDVGSLPGGGSQ